VDNILQSVGRDGTKDIAFTVPAGDAEAAVESLRDYCEAVGAKELRADNDVAKISIVGAGMETHENVAAGMFEALADEGINIQMISTSEIKISCLINKDDAQAAVKALHDVFNLGCDEIADVKGTLPDV
jgi:aspartate kinase